jgi:hypothetical protein
VTGREREWVALGDKQEATPARQRAAMADLDAAYSYAVKSKTHLWIATTAHRLSESTLDAFDGKSTEMPILDAENLIAPPALGCYVCEGPYEPLLRLRRCPGEPKAVGR